MTTNNYGPSLNACKLFEKTSAKGNVYMTGRLGGIKVTLMKSRETADDGSPIWEMKFSEASPYKPRDTNGNTDGGADTSERRANRPGSAPRTTSRRAAMADYARPPRTVTAPSAGSGPDSEIPF